MIKIILLLLLFDINKDPTIVDTFDMIEVNHYHNDWGVEKWSQLICWDWRSYDNSFRVEYWVMMKDAYEKTEEGEKKWEKQRRKIADQYKDFNQRQSWLNSSQYKGDFEGGKLYPKKDWKSGYYEIQFIDGGVSRTIRAKIFRETYTQHDPEVADRDFHETESRRGLRKIEKKKIDPTWQEFVDKLVPLFHP